MMDVVLYMRYSSDRQTEQSIEGQNRVGFEVRTSTKRVLSELFLFWKSCRVYDKTPTDLISAGVFLI